VNVQRWLTDAVVGGVLAALAGTVGQLATRGGIESWETIAMVSALSFVVYPFVAAMQRRRQGRR
jgi:hypothetical protein